MPDMIIKFYEGPKGPVGIRVIYEMQEMPRGKLGLFFSLTYFNPVLGNRHLTHGFLDPKTAIRRKRKRRAK